MSLGERYGRLNETSLRGFPTGETKEGKKNRKKSKAKSPRMTGTEPLGFCLGRNVLPKVCKEGSQMHLERTMRKMHREKTLRTLSSISGTLKVFTATCFLCMGYDNLGQDAQTL